MIILRKIRLAAACIISSCALISTAFADDVITFAEADTITGESLINLIAFERAKERGVQAEAISLQSDDLVFQAVLNGQVEIGVGSAYAAIQTLGAASPVRNFYQLKKTKSFCLIHSKEINHQIGSSLNKRMQIALSKADFVIANSNFTKNFIIKLGLKHKNIKVINPGCNYPIKVDSDAKTFAKIIYGKSFPKLITISRLDGRKSHRNILMTIKNLLPKFPQLKYVSVGNGEERDNLEKLKKELGLKDEVSFIYNSSEQEKLALLEMSDLFVMPSIIYNKSIEGFGITFIEAASYGKASIGGIHGGEADAIVHGKTGYLCDGNDLNALYEVLLNTLNNENFKLLGTNALKFSKNFSWDKIIKKYIELI